MDLPITFGSPAHMMPQVIESAGDEVLAIYEKIIGEKLDLNVDFEDDDEDEG